ncbi:CRISPR-associated endonuclease Cas2 [Saccharobesus litoralis]|uniref:CRISPR-associated endoribonuclease Cas2 n=1 Tax=Saccharobesus litoralis TaxID=2172099 RepID=A0A2S0VXZ6_9ALTE|nr:CRISPR-associated endonuclease Cas2 [Saccharobesus litoralis]AWB69099.1 CRISPR-associated endonuclease Cas2 [Saccharobesus litoralis]
MLLVAYDISNNKLRTKFAKFLEKFGGRLQYSVFEITNSKRVLDIVLAEIEGEFADRFAQTDSIIIFNMSKQCKMTKFGYAKNSDEDLIII